MSEFECEKCGCPDKCAEGVLEGVIEERDDIAVRLAEAEAALGRVRELLPAWEVRYGDDSIDQEIDDLRRALDGTR